MLSFSTLIILILIAIVIGIWSSNLRSKEQVIRAVKTACAEKDLQLLDGTTQFVKFKLKRDPTSGRLRVFRIYSFEYFDGEIRQQGKVTSFANRNPHVEFHELKSSHASTPSNNVIPFRKSHKDH
jgi:hypothetical protein